MIQDCHIISSTDSCEASKYLNHSSIRSGPTAKMFWEHEAYKIARKITNGSPLYKDLVGHIYLLLYNRNIPEEDLPRTFARFAYNQYKWPGSDWNKQFNTMAHMVSLDYDIPLQSDDDNEEEGHQKYLREYMDKESNDDQELFIKEVTRMHLYGMTFRDIKAQTGLSLRVIHSAIKQFKYELYCNHPDINWTIQGSPDF